LSLRAPSVYRSAVEKIMYVGWRPDHVAPARLRELLLGDAADALLARGVRGLTIMLADERALAGLRITKRDPAAVVAVWVDSHLRRAALEEILAGVLARPAGYLALESVPLLDRSCVVPLGERIPGLYTVAFLEKPERLDYATWLAYWQGDHTAIAIASQRTFVYVQNVLVRALTPDAPPWAAIVEEGFPAAAATDPLRFYAAETLEELALQQRRMIASCERFIDFSRFETLPMSAYVMARPTP
jgi:hypothetical protein